MPAVRPASCELARFEPDTPAAEAVVTALVRAGAHVVRVHRTHVELRRLDSVARVDQAGRVQWRAVERARPPEPASRAHGTSARGASGSARPPRASARATPGTAPTATRPGTAATAARPGTAAATTRPGTAPTTARPAARGARPPRRVA